MTVRSALRSEQEQRQLSVILLYYIYIVFIFQISRQDCSDMQISVFFLAAPIE